MSCNCYTDFYEKKEFLLNNESLEFYENKYKEKFQEFIDDALCYKKVVVSKTNCCGEHNPINESEIITIDNIKQIYHLLEYYDNFSDFMYYEDWMIYTDLTDNYIKIIR